MGAAMTTTIVDPRLALGFYDVLSDEKWRRAVYDGRLERRRARLPLIQAIRANPNNVRINGWPQEKADARQAVLVRRYLEDVATNRAANRFVIRQTARRARLRAEGLI